VDTLSHILMLLTGYSYDTGNISSLSNRHFRKAWILHCRQIEMMLAALRLRSKDLKPQSNRLIATAKFEARDGSDVTR
jgi:hypothetical protein